jgi:hypothetical protein
VQQVPVVRTEPAEQREVVGPLEDVDAVDLQQAGPADDPLEVPPVHRAGRPRVGEALRGQRDPAGGGQRQPVHPPVLPALGPVVDPTGRP